MNPSSDLPLAWINFTLPNLPKQLVSKEKSSWQRKKEKIQSSDMTRVPYEGPTPKPSSTFIPDLSAKMNPALVFGLQVSQLVGLKQFPLMDSSSETESPESTDLQRNRALQHAQNVKEQLSQRSLIQSSAQAEPAKPRRVEGKKSRQVEPQFQRIGIFRFLDLPPEMRDMIYHIYFTRRKGKKPKLMWAFKCDGSKVPRHYEEAEKVYYKVNQWFFSVKDCFKNSILGNMDKYHVELLRKMTICISAEVSPTTILCEALKRAVNVDDLTLTVRSCEGAKRVIHEILPTFQQLRRVELSIQGNTRRRGDQRGGREDIRAGYKSFRSVKELLDRLLDQEGVCNQDTTKAQKWCWTSASSGNRTKTFKVVCPKKHIKFE